MINSNNSYYNLYDNPLERMKTISDRLSSKMLRPENLTKLLAEVKTTDRSKWLEVNQYVLDRFKEELRKAYQEDEKLKKCSLNATTELMSISQKNIDHYALKKMYQIETALTKMGYKKEVEPSPLGCRLV